MLNNMDKSQNKNAEWKKPDRKEYILHDSVSLLSIVTSVVVWRKVSGREWLQGNLGGDEYVHYLECGKNFIGIHVSKLIKLYTLNNYSLLLNKSEYATSKYATLA